MGKHAMDQNVRPRRRDLRRIRELNEEAQLRKREADTLAEEGKVEEVDNLPEVDNALEAGSVSELTDNLSDIDSVSEADSLSDTGETSVIDITQVADVELPQEKSKDPVSPSFLPSSFSRVEGFADKCSAAVLSGVHGNKRALFGIAASAAVVSLFMGAMSIHQANQAQAVAHHSVLKSGIMDTASADTPDVLADDPAAQAKAEAGERAQAAREIASDTQALCQGVDKGASSLVSAYVPEDLSPVYYPMQEGTYNISSPFGMRIHPIRGAYSMHTGVDLAGSSGTPIYSVADGVVLSVTAVGSNNGIVIEHNVNGKTFTSWYLHSYANEIFVSPGQEVKAGQKIALRGSAGMSTGPHLHFEMHWGAGMDTEAVEPLGALEELGAMDLSQECRMS